jgi:hypothetical protein
MTFIGQLLPILDRLWTIIGRIKGLIGRLSLFSERLIFPIDKFTRNCTVYDSFSLTLLIARTKGNEFLLISSKKRASKPNGIR